MENWQKKTEGGLCRQHVPGHLVTAVTEGKESPPVSSLEHSNSKPRQADLKPQSEKQLFYLKMSVPLPIGP